MGTPAPTPAPQAECSLLGGFVGYTCQLILFFVAFGSLLYKRHRERPRRGIKTWAMDVSKQVVSTGVGHLSGMFWSFLIQRMTTDSASECAWYFIMFTTDTTIGVGVAYWLHTTIVKFAKKKGQPDSCLYHMGQCGEYGPDPENPQWRLYLPQMAEFCGVVLIARIVCGVTIFIPRFWLNRLAKAIDSPFGNHPDIELASVMVLGPFLMNVIQAWIQDQYLKMQQRQEERLLDPDRSPSDPSINAQGFDPSPTRFRSDESVSDTDFDGKKLKTASSAAPQS